jgi:DNA-binding transcriptional regulator YiaG
MYKGGAKNMEMTLKACRVNVNASVKETSQATGISEYCIRSWESGATTPKVTQAQQLVKFYNSKNPSFNISVNDINFLP